MKKWKSTAAQCLLKRTGASSIEEAISEIASGLLLDVVCPPTDLDAIARRLNAKIIGDDIFGSGELRRTPEGYELVYANDLAVSRRRFTIAHELGHIILRQTGAAATGGKEVERLCDLIAVELLMPRHIFGPRISEVLNLTAIFRLARDFQASVQSTAQRCAELRPITILEVSAGKIIWCFGALRRSTALQDAGFLEHVQRACKGDSGAVAMYLNDNSSLLPALLEYKALGRTGRALCLLARTSAADAKASISAPCTMGA